MSLKLRGLVFFFFTRAIYLYNKYPEKETTLKKSMLNRLTEVDGEREH